MCEYIYIAIKAHDLVFINRDFGLSLNGILCSISQFLLSKSATAATVGMWII